MFVYDFLITKRPKYFAGALLTFRILTLYFTGLMYVNIVMSENTWEFEPKSIRAVINWVVFVWIVLLSCPLMSHLRYWRKVPASSMKFYGSL